MFAINGESISLAKSRNSSAVCSASGTEEPAMSKCTDNLPVYAFLHIAAYYRAKLLRETAWLYALASADFGSI